MALALRAEPGGHLVIVLFILMPFKSMGSISDFNPTEQISFHPDFLVIVMDVVLCSKNIRLFFNVTVH